MTSGGLYFLKEKDFFSGEKSEYVKIGIIKDPRKTEDRIPEHQTGNPRKISIIKL